MLSLYSYCCYYYHCYNYYHYYDIAITTIIVITIVITIDLSKYKVFHVGEQAARARCGACARAHRPLVAHRASIETASEYLIIRIGFRCPIYHRI